jgi:hypothetical protein
MLMAATFIFSQKSNENTKVDSQKDLVVLEQSAL